MALGLSRFLLHCNKQVIIGHLGHTTLMELSLIGLVIAHNTSGFLLLTILDKVGQTEVKQIVTGHNQQVIIQLQLLNGEKDILYCTKASLVRRGAIIDNGNLVLAL